MIRNRIAKGVGIALVLAALGGGSALAANALSGSSGAPQNGTQVPIPEVSMSSSSAQGPRSSGGLDEAPISSRLSGASQRAPIAAVPSAASRAFSLLDRPAGVGMPADTKTALSKTPSAQTLGVNFDFARLLTSAGEVPQLWLAPGDDALCLYVIYSSDDGGSTCQSIDGTIAGKLSVTRAPGTGDSAAVGTVTFGVAPDGVQTVTASQGGVAEAVAVTGNWYEVKAG